ncbi:MAG: hypothetical protein AAFQ02_09075 [Bacteroidota bacterium]
MSRLFPLAFVTDHYAGESKLIAVIACVLIILGGIVFFLLYLEKRIKKLEEEADLRT